MSDTGPDRWQTLKRRWLRIAVALLALGMLSIAWLSNRPGLVPDAAVDTQQRMPIRTPILESDRPDLLSEPGMESIEDLEDDPEDPR